MFFCKNSDQKPSGLITTLVDDALAAGGPSAQKLEENIAGKLKATKKAASFPLKLSGCTLNKEHDAHLAAQSKHACSLESLSLTERDF